MNSNTKLKFLCKDRCFKEILENISEIILKLNISIEFTDIVTEKDNNSDIYLIFGKDIINIQKLPSKYIIFQLNSITTNNKNEIDQFFGEKYINIMKNALSIWDYSIDNINKLKKFYNFNNLYHIPFYYHKFTDYSHKISSKHKNIDIFFNEPHEQIPRRKELLDKLKQKYTIYTATNNIWDSNKINNLYKSKLVLNILYNENDIIEFKNLWFMLNNKAFIISEYNQNSDILSDNNLSLETMSNYITCTSYDNLEFLIDTYLSNIESGQHLSDKLMTDSKKKHNKWKSTYFEKSIINFPMIKNNINKSITNNKKKQKSIKPSGFIDYYTPIPIQSVEIESDKEKGEIKLKLPYISDEDLPHISLITPTKNRKFIFNLAIYNFNGINYPKEKIEWIILNNGNECLKDLLPDDKRIKYITIEENKYSIGELRNMCIDNCSNNYIVYMDDDDYYHPNSVKARIQSLLKYKNEGIECVGCDNIGFFNIMNGENTMGSNEKNYLGEASMAHTKNFWLERKYSNDKIGEYKNFLIYRQHKILNIPYEFIMIAINHMCNTTGMNRFNKKEFDDNWKSNDFKDLLFKYFNEDVQKILLDSVLNKI